MIICVDPGHGGKDPGAVGSDPFELYEKDVNLYVAVYLKERLERNGHYVQLTRTGDKRLRLSKRSGFANLIKANLFVSIHCNSTTYAAAEGIETWIYPGSKSGRKFATSVQKHLVSSFPDHKNRGVKEAKFYVLRTTQMPAILVECEFISNPDQLLFLSRRINQQAIAAAIANGIKAA